MDLPFPSGSDRAPGFRPRCKVAPGPSGGGGGLLGAVASLLSAPQADPWAVHLRRAETTLGAAPFLDLCRLELSRDAATPAVALGDPLSVQLGYQDALTPVFSGTVVGLNSAPRGGLGVLLASPAHALARRRQNAGFEQHTLADLLGQWASEAEVTPGNLDRSPSYPYLAIDDRRSLWDWIAVLARQAGCLAWVDADGKLNCRAPGGPPARRFRYGQEVLALAADSRLAATGTITVAGEGAAGSQGAQAWSWLAKQADAISASAGSGPPARLHQDGALRSHEAVAACAEAIAAQGGRREHTVSLTVPGSPELGVGSVFTLADCPDGQGDGDYVALRLRHRYDKARGFVTELSGVAA